MARNEASHGMLGLNSFLLVILMFFTLFGNILILLSLWKNKRLHKTAHLHSASLALANLIPGTTIVPLRIARVWKESGANNEETELCKAFLTFTLLWCVVSILTLATTSFDRYIAISRPHSYSRILTKAKVVILLVIVWCISVLISFLSLNQFGGALKLFNCNFNLLRKENYAYLLLTVEVIPLILMFIVHYQIMKLSAKHVQSIGVVDSREINYRPIPLNMSAEIRWSRIVILIILLYVLVWAPRCIFLLVNVDSLSESSQDTFDVLTEVSTYSFSGLVPLVLVYFNGDVREEFFRLTLPYQWFQKLHGAGKKYNNQNSVAPDDIEIS